MEPWICPRCQTVWAGWVARCTCVVVNTQSASTITKLPCPDCGQQVAIGAVHTCVRRESTTVPS